LNPEKINRAFRSAKASLAVEDLHVSEREEKLIKQKLSGEINETEFKQRALDVIHE
jgi:hypothetical protein